MAEPILVTETLPGPADDAAHMAEALAEARAAVAHDDVPIGAVVVREGVVIARAHNRREADHDPAGHAELIALREAGARLGRWRLSDCALYVTLEPCVMCAGAVVLARLPLVVFGTPDPKAGAVISIAQILDDRALNHHPRWRMGVRREDCDAVLKDFFALRRGAAEDAS